MSSGIRRIFDRLDQIQHPYTFLSVYFLLTRVCLWKIRPFDVTPLYGNMHYLDLSILKDHLLDGLYHLHTQPPLFNLFLGLVVKAGPEAWWRLSFATLYSLMGLAVTLALYRILRAFDVSRSVALLSSAAMAVFPSMIQGETWLYYAYPVAFLLALSAVALVYALEGNRVGYGMLFLGSLAMTVLSRSAFHVIAWMLPLVVMFMFLYRLRGERKFLILAISSVLALAMASVPFVTNYKRYGVFQSSTWRGISVYSMTFFTSLGDPARIEKLIAEGKVTPLARVLRSAPAEVYLDYYKETKKTGVPVLDEPNLSPGNPNFNHFIYPRADEEIFRNSLIILREYPMDYVKAVVNQTYIFFGFSPYRYFFGDQSWRVPRTSHWGLTVYDVVMLYVVPPVFFLLFWLSLKTLGTRLLVEWRQPVRNVARIGLLAYLLFTITYVTLETLLIVFGEGNYVRIPIDPLSAVGLALAADVWIKYQRQVST